MAKPWLEARYYCRNTAGGCEYARSDALFSADECRRAAGLCAGRNADGCGQPLVAGAAKNHLPRWTVLAVCATAAIVCLGWLMRTLLFPAPIEQVDFASRSSQVSDQAGIASLEVVRRGAADRQQTVAYSCLDGSAKSSEDYEPVSGKLVFLKGERRKTLVVAILPDATFQKSRRHFQVTLTNAAGQPQHIVQIVPRTVDRNEQVQAEQLVRAASQSAKDVADFHVRLQTLEDVLSDGAQSADLDTFRESQSITRGNLTRARESYLRFLLDLQSYRPGTVLQAMQNISKELRARDYQQQAAAVDIMKQHYNELLNKQPPDMDRWVAELATVVPRLAPKSNPAAT